MKINILALVLGLFTCTFTYADYDTDTIRNKKNGGYFFSELTNIDHNIVQNQCRTGTCWSYSSLSFFESELIRLGKPKVNLSEMFIVRGAYIEKARNYIRMDGHFNFGQGGAFHDILYIMDRYGIVPESEYTGLNYGTDKHNHSEMSGMLKAQLDVIKKKPQGGKLTPNWIKAVKGTVEAYLGEAPKKFTFEGKEYTPITFRDYLGIVPSDYVSLTSFTHHPFYSQFVIEVPDNWAMQSSYNLPLEELWEVMETSLKNGYTWAWGSDVSEKGFSFRNGIAIVPVHDSLLKVKGKDNKFFSNAGSEKMGNAFDSPQPEKKITQAMRQEGFDNKTTTDDHGMHAVGIAIDQNGTKYVKIKNSWGTPNYLKGYMYISKAFMKYKTINIQIHKDAIPKGIKKKLGIK